MSLRKACLLFVHFLKVGLLLVSSWDSWNAIGELIGKLVCCWLCERWSAIGQLQWKLVCYWSTSVKAGLLLVNFSESWSAIGQSSSLLQRHPVKRHWRRCGAAGPARLASSQCWCQSPATAQGSRAFSSKLGILKNALILCTRREDKTCAELTQ